MPVYLVLDKRCTDFLVFLAAFITLQRLLPLLVLFDDAL